MHFSKDSLLLYAVTDRTRTGGKRLAEQVEDALRGGVTCVQLREKDLSDEEFLREAKALKTLCHRSKTPLIVNDNVEVAMLSGVDGVHVGQQDAPVHMIRDMAGNDLIIGVSVSTIGQALRAQKDGADYLGVGAVFPTLTKDDADIVTIETVRAICKSVSIPVVAIGGISLNNINRLADTGISGVALVSAIFDGKSVEENSKRFKTLASDLFGSPRSGRNPQRQNMSDTTPEIKASSLPSETSSLSPDASSLPPDASSLTSKALSLPPEALPPLPEALSPPPEASSLPSVASSLPPEASSLTSAVNSRSQRPHCGKEDALPHSPAISSRRQCYLHNKKTGIQLPIETAIFDMDGTLLDSMGAYERLPEQYLLELNIQPRENLSERFRAMSFREAAKIYQDDYGVKSSVAEILHSFDRIIADFYSHEVLPKPGVPEFLEKLASYGINMCIATLTDGALARAALEHCGLLKHFAFIITCSEVGVGKEQPDVFLAAMDRLNSDISSTVVFEDASHAVKSAAGAGFKVVGVYDDSFKNYTSEIKKLSAIYIESFLDLDVF